MTRGTIVVRFQQQRKQHAYPLTTGEVVQPPVASVVHPELDQVAVAAADGGQLPPPRHGEALAKRCLHRVAHPSLRQPAGVHLVQQFGGRGPPLGLQIVPPSGDALALPLPEKAFQGPVVAIVEPAHGNPPAVRRADRLDHAIEGVSLPVHQRPPVRERGFECTLRIGTPAAHLIEGRLIARKQGRLTVQCLELLDPRSVQTTGGKLAIDHLPHAALVCNQGVHHRAGGAGREVQLAARGVEVIVDTAPTRTKLACLLIHPREPQHPRQVIVGLRQVQRFRGRPYPVEIGGQRLCRIRELPPAVEVAGDAVEILDTGIRECGKLAGGLPASLASLLRIREVLVELRKAPGRPDELPVQRA